MHIMSFGTKNNLNSCIHVKSILLFSTLENVQKNSNKVLCPLIMY